MNDINKMPPKCQYCPYWEVCKYPWVCPDIGEKKPKRTDKRTETHASDLIDRQPSYSCSHENDIISRTAAIDAIDEIESEIAEGCGFDYEKWRKHFCNLPPAQPGRKRGQWRHYEGFLTCSECRTEYDDDIMTHCCDDVPKFCPNCGADMREESE